MIILQSDDEGLVKSTSIGLMFPPDLKVERRRDGLVARGDWTCQRLIRVSLWSLSTKRCSLSRAKCRADARLTLTS